MNLFDRIDIIIDGYELTARPVKFEFDVDNTPLEVLEYETTCPLCGNLILFNNNDAVVMSGKKYVGCYHCNKGFVDNKKPAKIKKDKVEIIENGQIIGVKIEEKDRGCPFIDPVEFGIYDPTKA